MHDWILKEIRFDWATACAVIEFKDSTFAVRTLTAEGVKEMHIPRVNDWGPSVNVNEAFAIEVLASGFEQLRIEMQSGDVIQIVAELFVLPENKNT